MTTAIRFLSRSKKGNTAKLVKAVSESLGIEALPVTEDLPERVERLFLLNAMYAANVDREGKVVSHFEPTFDMKKVKEAVENLL